MDEMNDTVKPSAQADVSAKRRSKAKTLFIGTYSHTVDAKGRIVVPQSFRDKLGETFVVAPSIDFKSIGLYPEEAWEETYNRYTSLDEFNAELQLLMEQFVALSFGDQECDGQGRVLLPPRIRQLLLGDDKDLEISGAGDHVNITTAAVYADKFQQVIDGMPAIRKTIDQLRARSLMAGHTVLREKGDE